MDGTMLGKGPKKLQTMPSSNNTVSQRISDMAGDVLKQLLLGIQAREFNAFQLEESIDMESIDIDSQSSLYMAVKFMLVN